MKRKIKSKSKSNKTIILDIDHTLVCCHPGNLRMETMSPRECSNVKFIKLENSYSYLILRPHLREFLVTCFNFFSKVVVWSAGTEDYVHEVCSIIFNGLRMPDYIFTREHIKNFSEENIAKNIKDILPIIDEKDIDNVLIIDDRTESFIHNEDNGILIPHYFPIKDEFIFFEDKCLSQLKNWIEKLDPDFRLPKINKNFIFTEFLSI